MNLPNPFRWPGGKGRLSKLIIPSIPSHHTFIEVFGGAASLIFKKEPSPEEIYNDLDEDLVNFFRVLQDDNKFERFLSEIKKTPCNKQELDKAQKIYKKLSPNSVERAAKWFVATDMGYQGKIYNPSTWANKPKNLRKQHERFKDVRIENLDFKELIPKYENTDACFYLDPPYVLETRTGKIYPKEMTDDDHSDLLDLLLKSKGKFILSGYDDPLYNKLLQNGWFVQHYSNAKDSQKNKTTEILWCNFGQTAYTKKNTEEEFSNRMRPKITRYYFNPSFFKDQRQKDIRGINTFTRKSGSNKLLGKKTGKPMEHNIAIRPNTLPIKIGQLHNLVVSQNAKLKAAHVAAIALRKLGPTKEERDKAIRAGQKIAEKAFNDEAKLGKLLMDFNLKGGDRKSEYFQNQSSPTVTLKSLGISKKESYEAQKIAAHPKAIQDVLITAELENDIPNRADILREIDANMKIRLRSLLRQNDQDKRHEDKIDKELEKMSLREEIRKEGLSKIKTLGFARTKRETICLHSLDRICLILLPRLYRYEMLMEELLDNFKTLEKAGGFQIAVEQALIKKFLGSCFTQDFIAILEMFDFKIQYPEGIKLSPRNNRYQRVKKHRKRMAFYRKKGKLRPVSYP